MTVTAYIFCKVKMGSIQKVVDMFKEIDVATSIAVTTGEFDVIVRVELPDLESLYNLTVTEVCRIPGLEETTTAVVTYEIPQSSK
jgi:DNA-binding Lrp family transcriptional regulator